MPPPIWVTEAVVEIYGMQPGASSNCRWRVGCSGSCWSGLARLRRQFGAIAIDAADYEPRPATPATEAALWLMPGRRPAREDCAPQMEAAPRREFGSSARSALSLRIFDRSFAVTYVLEVAAIVIGLIGIAATFSTQAIARTREFGMLRHLG